MATLDQAFANTLGALTNFGQLGLGRQELALRERLGMQDAAFARQRLGLMGRQVALEELEAPERIAALEAEQKFHAFRLYQAMQEGPISIAKLNEDLAQAKTVGKFMRDLIDEGDEMTISLAKEAAGWRDSIAQGVGSVWTRLRGLNGSSGAAPAGLADMVAVAGMEPYGPPAPPQRMSDLVPMPGGADIAPAMTGDPVADAVASATAAQQVARAAPQLAADQKQALAKRKLLDLIEPRLANPPPGIDVGALLKFAGVSSTDELVNSNRLGFIMSRLLTPEERLRAHRAGTYDVLLNGSP